MTLNPKASPYRIYLLTLWAERSEEAEVPAIWRCSLKDPQTGQQRAFATLTALVAALVEEMARIEGTPLKGDEAS
ncbi:MAG: hypothetical protein KJ077_37810 [Anaerolineae bacterium]|nr:hypothetical protein [Anaerolineae bacterium]